MAKTKSGKQNGPETLSQYVKRIIEQKGLSLKDVEVMSGGRITDAYVANIIQGRASNPSVEKLKALAVGLSVDEDEIFKVARGLYDGQPSEPRTGDPSHTRMMLKLMEKVAISPTLTRILQELVKLSAENQEAVRKFIEAKSKQNE